MSFERVFAMYKWDDVKASILAKSHKDVENALSRSGKKSLEDFKALLSPAATRYLEEMAKQSRSITQKRFGKTIQLFAPMYLSNECHNVCTYCGFSFGNKVRRKTLSEDEILREVEHLKSLGFDHILLVTGEDQTNVALPYFKKALSTIRPHFSNISLEVQPLDTDEYAELTEIGLHSVLVYQETYHQDDYRKHHPKGKKAHFGYRLDTPDRLGAAGVHKIGLGVLYGLEDWRTDTFFVGAHLDYLEKTYWKTKYSVSFPRLRPFSGGLEPKVEMSDKELAQVIFAYRIFNEEVELSLSTRESPRFRDNMLSLGITSMSAGSKTNPGGYVVEPTSLEQFEIHDDRTPAEIASLIQSKGYERMWKDWERSFLVV